uniref:LOW QUALITY PROTEIN: cardiolipin synthase (CMP-forming) n=1 Tax=Gasterosteus aculeatus aculeatus TaxID=481459 RepID=UPI001A993145|nr:LOW QUALITY PROTEIN: cardiolipin synthase (CMP-forming) [Gasterosteus aculeatus aculeatus]
MRRHFTAAWQPAVWRCDPVGSDRQRLKPGHENGTGTMMMCLRNVSGPLWRNAATVRRLASAGALPLRVAASRRHAPAADYAPLTRSPVCGGLLRLKGDALPHRGGHGRSAAGLRSPLLRGARGLCSGKAEGTPDSARPGDRNQGGDPLPGEGLFKFKELYENPWTIPNFLCVSRIVLAPFLGHLVIQQHFHLSLALFTLAGATDLLDGYIARTWTTQKSALGSALDPVSDKILISILYVSLTYAELIPAPLTALVISRDVGLIAAVFWVRYKTVPPPVTLSRFFNPCYTTAQLKPTLFSKVNTAIQLLLVASSLAAPVFQYTDSVLLQCLWYITAVTTAASGYSYWHYGRETVRVLNTRSP